MKVGMRRLAILVIVAAVVPALLLTRPARASVLVLTIDGKGWGHGVGMAQDGAFWMAGGGMSAPQILGHFYPGTTLGRAGGPVRVAVLNAPSNDALIAFPDGGEVRDARSGQQSPGFPVRVGPGGQVHLWFDCRYHAQPVGPATARTAAGASH